ncbi:MAG: gamma carbonic anhydrase family protein [Nitrospinota bacterium]
MILPYRDKWPRIDPSAWVAPTAVVAGDVEVGEESGIWFHCLLRGDVNYIRIGRRTNIQDGCLVHVYRDLYPTIIGDGVTVGHGAILHGCRVEDGALIGIGARVLDGAQVGEGAVVGPGALVKDRYVVPPRTLVVGLPARAVRKLKEEELQRFRDMAEQYSRLKDEYKRLPEVPPSP